MMKPKSPTYRSIAQKAGVSLATVGYALRNSPEVSEETRKRIKKIATSMGYTPNPIFSAMMRRHRHRLKQDKIRAILGLFLMRRTANNLPLTSVGRDQIAGLENACAEEGFLCERFIWEDFQESPRQLFANLRARNIPGVVFMYDVPEWAVALDEWSRYAMIGLGGSPRRIGIHCSLANHHANAWLLMEKLTELGYQNIGFALRHMSPYCQEFAAYTCWMNLQKLAENNPELACVLHTKGLTTSKGQKLQMPPPFLPIKWEETAFLKWMEKHKPDALVFAEEEPIRFLERAGWRIPEDVGIAHFYLDSTWTHRAGIRQNSIEEGQAAAYLVIDQINRGARGVPLHPQHTLTKGNWHEGPSVRKIPSSL